MCLNVVDGIFSKRFYPPAFDAPVSRRNIAMTFDTENLEWRGYPMVKKSLRIRLLILTDGHTERRTPHDV